MHSSAKDSTGPMVTLCYALGAFILLTQEPVSIFTLESQETVYVLDASTETNVLLGLLLRTNDGPCILCFEAAASCI